MYTATENVCEQSLTLCFPGSVEAITVKSVTSVTHSILSAASARTEKEDEEAQNRPMEKARERHNDGEEYHGPNICISPLGVRFDEHGT